LKSLNPKFPGLIALAAVLTILVVSAGTLAACGSGSSSSTPTAAGTPKPGGTYVYPIGAEPISIEPLNVQTVDDAQVTHQIFQGLYILQEQPNGTTTAVPDLAAKTEMSPDAKTFTFTIKQGIKFAPPVNREVTAQDFYDSWNYMLDPAHKSATASYVFQNLAGLDPKSGLRKGPKLTSVKVLSKYTFQVTLQSPFSQFPVTLANDATKVFPVDYATKVGLQAFANKPVGTGPYMLASWKHNQSLSLVKNPDYWNTSGSGNSATSGYVDTINFPIYHDDSTMYLAFQKGTLDFSPIPQGSWLAAQNLPNVKNGTWTAKAYPNAGVQFISVSMGKPTLGGSANLPIRAALNYAVDRNAVCNVVNQGVLIPNDEIVPQSMPGYMAGLNPYPYDPSKAQPELDKFTAAGGKLPQNIPYWYNTGYGAAANAQALIAGWQKAMPSLTFKVSGLETNAYFTAVDTLKPPALFRLGWSADWPSIDDFIYLFTTKGGLYGSYTQYSNPQVDKLFSQARATADVTQANNLYNEAQKLILADAPCVPVFTYRDPRITTNRIGGFNYNAYAFVDMWKLWVK
jgi:oligopeptide transport system substrate-binding protein